MVDRRIGRSGRAHGRCRGNECHVTAFRIQRRFTGGPARDAIRELHDRVKEGSLDALNELIAHFLRVVPSWLRRAFPRASDELRVDAAEDALVEYAARPTRFDPARGIPLEAYLLRAASRNLINRLDAERRRKAREDQYAQQTAINEAIRERPEPHSSYLGRIEFVLSGAESDAEKCAMKLWLKGERQTRAFAEALGLGDLPAEEQRIEVKRFKDRIVKRLGRRLRRT
jgi:DNA-directed RNA polymerase specialized sigma24 family protein